MAKLTFLADLWPRLEPLTDERIEAVLAEAKTSTWFRLRIAAIFVAFVAAIAVLAISVPLIYAATRPSPFIKLLYAGVILLAIWGATRLTIRQVRQVYHHAILRELDRGSLSDGA